MKGERSMDVVVGQGDKSTVEDTSSQTRMRPNGNDWEWDGVASDGTHVVAAEHNASRFLQWTPVPNSDGEPAAIVFGHADFTSTSSGTSAAEFGSPTGLWIDSEPVIASSIHEHRVLVWSRVPTQNGAEADIVLGQPDFASSSSSPPSPFSVSDPHGIHVANGRLYVVDTGNHRVLVWDEVPNATYTPADYALGQPDLYSGEPNAGRATTHAGGFDRPANVFVLGDSLYVTDPGNNRIVGFTPIPTGPDAVATSVIGQQSLDEAVTSEAPTSDRFGRPIDLTYAGGYLFVTDRDFNRVLAFALQGP